MKPNKELFFEIADIIDFKPDLYTQAAWGAFVPTEGDRYAFEEKYHLFPDNGYLSPGNEDDGRWTELGCQTAMCVAGWACNLKGYNPSVKMITVTENGESVTRPRFDWNMVSKLKRWENRGPMRNTTHDVAEIARKLLRITEEESALLFHGDAVWTGDDLRAFGKGESIEDYAVGQDLDDD